MKISKSDYEALPASLKANFTQVAGTEEYDNGEESVSGLKTALQKEKDEAAALKGKLSAFEAEKLKDIEAARKKALEDARTSGDFAAIEKDYQRRIKELEDANKAAAKQTEDRLKADAINAEVDKLAANFVSPALAKAAIRERLSCELVDGSPVVRVLKDGKPSGLSVSDLEKEYLTGAEYKGSIVASKASGGGSGEATKGGGSGFGDTSKPFDAANASPKDLVARLEAKGAVKTSEDDE